MSEFLTSAAQSASMTLIAPTRPRLREILARSHPELRAFYEYWDRKRAGRRMPARADLDPAEMVRFLPNLILADVESLEPLSLVYRLVGTREVAFRGKDPTGQKVAEGFSCRSRAAALAHYRMVIERRMPIFDNDRRTSPQAALSEHGTIFLPLSDDGQTVNKVLVYTAFESG